MNLSEWKRTARCAEVEDAQIGQRITLNGWVQRTRNLGALIFVWLRDRSGIIQVVFDAESAPDCFPIGEELRSEYVLAVEGTVRARAEKDRNPQLKTGNIELWAERAVILNRSETPPIYVQDGTNENEAVRLKYRYIDLRRPSLQKTLLLRHKVIRAIREYMDAQSFVEIETPIMTKSTPEGARDYLVPSRVHPGEFYALPQSPQIYKQLLMLAGFDRYYQIARCFRDEDLRADRQPEFTQLDLEMSFVEPLDVQNVVEGAFAAGCAAAGVQLQLPLPRMTWQHAMDTYGSDKPDTRYALELVNVSDLAEGCGFSVFEGAVAAGGSVRGIRFPDGAKLTRKEIDSLGEFVKTYRAKGLAWAKVNADGSVLSPIRKFFEEARWEQLQARMSLQPGDIAFFVADRNSIVLASLGALRQEIAKRFALIPAGLFNAFWVTEFPLFERDEETGELLAMHHPFTSPMDEDLDIMESQPEKTRAKAYDLVLNGIEMGSGSIRIHESDKQARMFALLGLSQESVATRFGFLLEAFKYGTPPHGGFGMGIDRMLMILSGADSLRDVIAFPKVQNASDLMMGTPSPVPEDQLEILRLAIVPEED